MMNALSVWPALWRRSRMLAARARSRRSTRQTRPMLLLQRSRIDCAHACECLDIRHTQFMHTCLHAGDAWRRTGAADSFDGMDERPFWVTPRGSFTTVFGFYSSIGIIGVAELQFSMRTHLIECSVQWVVEKCKVCCPECRTSSEVFDVLGAWLAAGPGVIFDENYKSRPVWAQLE